MLHASILSKRPVFTSDTHTVVVFLSKRYDKISIKTPLPQACNALDGIRNHNFLPIFQK